MLRHRTRLLLMGALTVATLVSNSGSALAKNPFRPGALDESRAILGLWKMLETDEKGELRLLGLMLHEDGRFSLVAGDTKGKVVGRVEGRYVYKSGKLRLVVEDELYAEMTVGFGDDALNLTTGAKSTHWVKDRP